MGTGEGNTGTPSTLLEERCMTSGAGPGRPAGPGVGGSCSSGARATGTTTPCGRARFAVPVSLPGQYPASWPIRARIQLNFSKVSQNGQVSPEYVHKACHSPCFQNLVQKSALEILRFPFSPAFSHKELMTLFWPDSRFLVRMTKCRLNVHTGTRRVAQYPHGHAQQAAPA